MAISSKSEICTMALSLQGDFGTIHDIDTPTNDKERTFALWYDVCRQFVLKLMMPNFALARDIVSRSNTVPPFGYAYYYDYPQLCLKVLGVGEIKDKENNYGVEGNRIMHDTLYDTGMPLRFIKDIDDVNQFSPEFKILLSEYLAAYTALPNTQDVAKATALMNQLPAKMSTASGLNAQENMPIRISKSLYKQSRYNGYPTNTDKK